MSSQKLGETWQDVLIYGRGGFGSTIELLIEKLGTRVVGFIDKRAERGDGSLMTVEDAYLQYGNLPVIIGVFSPQPNIHEITLALKLAGFSNVVSPPQLMRVLCDHAIEFRRYWLSSCSEDIDVVSDKIEHVSNLLVDRPSRHTLEQLVSYRLTGEIRFSPTPLPLSDQYVGRDFQFLETLPFGIFVDCGAFNGDSIVNWERAGARPPLIYALEPDPSNFQALCKTIETSSISVAPFSVGASDQSGLFTLSGDGPSTTLIKSSSGDVRCTSIDDLVGNERVSLIKMDIEGSESLALLGAERTIRRNRPHLAISVYHRPSDLWEIPLWITKHFPGYRMSLATYGHQGYDTVVYAYYR